MLMDIKCSTVASVAVHLTFDDNTVKDLTLAAGDLVYIEFNKNGLRRSVEGKIIKVSCVGSDPKGWYIIVDGSENYDSAQCKISVNNILDCEVIYKNSNINCIQTPKDNTGISFLRVVKGKLQYSNNGTEWHNIDMRDKDFIKDEEGTIPSVPSFKDDEFEIKDEVY